MTERMGALLQRSAAAFPSERGEARCRKEKAPTSGSALMQIDGGGAAA